MFLKTETLEINEVVYDDTNKYLNMSPGNNAV